MPSVRLIALPPAQGQHLQLLRGASSTSTGSPAWGTKASRHEKHANEVNVHARANARATSSSSTITASSSQPSRCRNPPNAVAFFHARSAATSGIEMSTAFCCGRILRGQRPLPATTRPFNSVTMAKQVAFPRHGKAVAPRLPEDAKASNDKGGKVRVPRASERDPDTSKESFATPPREKQPVETNGKQAKAAVESNDPTTAAAAPSTLATPSTPRGESQAALSSGVPTETNALSTNEPPPLEAPTTKVDVQEAFGSSGEFNTELDLSDPSSIAADAAAASVAAAETAGLAADIVNGADVVIELGPPPEMMIGTIGTPNEDQSGTLQPNHLDSQQQQQQQQQAEDPSSSSSPPARQLLAHNRLPPPHLAPPLYVHHFDSYSLVKQLEEGGYRKEQAVTAMKAVRSLLAQHLDLAQTSLVSKSDVENESYLFKAACAELSVEVRNNRRRADELVRQQRTLLQHEVDIAAQSVNQELLTLADVVKELFDDRKMAVREEQKTRESAIQQLSYKITIMLNSEMRSEIEGLRWVLIRRSVLGIIFMAILTLGTLRYASYISHEKQRNAERALWEAREAEAQRFADTKIDTSAPFDAAETLAAN
ncbi:hypothetical protein SEPCBS57363_005650 [Sporothrix epigloea]|uniref:MOZ protein represents a chromatin-associated acetyltransferase n=1 Tax=Sporothrix epigloea TaxID=1892477 RepID=A0ABP0E2P1_9PEZI